MIITAMALVLPTVLYTTLTKTVEIGDKILSFSRATAVVLLVIYVIYLYFQLHTHREVFLDEADDVGIASGESDDRREGNGVREQQPEQEDRPETSSQSPYTAIVVLIVSAAAIMTCTHYFIDNLDATTKFTHFSKTFIAMILIPIASNAPECSAVIMASRKGRINYAIGVIVGSILQIALFVLPILVVIGWILDKPMTLYFEMSQTSILFLAVLMVNHLLQDGTYTYLHGIMLLSL
jgi:Ca2+:H+ antiporter